MAIPDVNLQELNIKSSMILHSISTIEITSAELQSEVLVCKIKFLGADFG